MGERVGLMVAQDQLISSAMGVRVPPGHPATQFCEGVDPVAAEALTRPDTRLDFAGDHGANPGALERLDAPPGVRYGRCMCRNIRVLSGFQPPTTLEEMQAASLQYVRKISGMRAPSQSNQASFDLAVERVTAATRELLAALELRTAPRTREDELRKARQRAARRFGPRTAEASD